MTHRTGGTESGGLGPPPEISGFHTAGTKQVDVTDNIHTDSISALCTMWALSVLSHRLIQGTQLGS